MNTTWVSENDPEKVSARLGGTLFDEIEVVKENGRIASITLFDRVTGSPAVRLAADNNYPSGVGVFVPKFPTEGTRYYITGRDENSGLSMKLGPFTTYAIASKAMSDQVADLRLPFTPEIVENSVMVNEEDEVVEEIF